MPAKKYVGFGQFDPMLWLKTSFLVHKMLFGIVSILVENQINVTC